MYGPGLAAAWVRGRGPPWPGLAGRGLGRGALFPPSMFRKAWAARPGRPSPVDLAPPDFVYVRVYDTDIRRPGVRVPGPGQVEEPNYQKTDHVSKKSDAEHEEMPPLEEHWYTFPQKISVPQSGYQYVIDPVKAEAKESNPLPTPKEGRRSSSSSGGTTTSSSTRRSRSRSGTGSCPTCW